MKSAPRLLLVLGAGLLHCGRVEHWMNDLPPTDADRRAETTSWGDYVATLDVPPCPPGGDLVVNTTTDELDGGITIAEPPPGGSLSLVEALFIAANRPGQDNVYFDPGVFSTTPAGVIRLVAEAVYPADVPDLCIDGRGRGVVVEWEGSAHHLLLAGANSAVIGLTFVSRGSGTMGRLGSRTAGCQFVTVGAGAFEWINAFGGEIGPGNVFAMRGVTLWGGDTWIHDNHFGFDPLTGTSLGLRKAIQVRTRAAVMIERNDFAAVTACEDQGLCVGVIELVVGSPATIRNNRFGLGADGAPHAGIGVRLGNDARAVVGPANLMRGFAKAVDVASPSAIATITHNSIFDNDAGIVTVSPAAPTIASATVTAVSGTCSADGTVELFSDTGSQGETFLGDAPCTAGAFTWSGAVPSGRNVTATLTDTAGATSAFSQPVPAP